MAIRLALADCRGIFSWIRKAWCLLPPHGGALSLPDRHLPCLRPGDGECNPSGQHPPDGSSDWGEGVLDSGGSHGQSSERFSAGYKCLVNTAVSVVYGHNEVVTGLLLW